MRLKAHSKASAGLAAATLLATFATGSALAQTNAADDPAAQGGGDSPGLEEVIVTAQRREESLQKSSLVLNVVTADQIDRAGVTQPQALTSILPGVQIGTIGPTTQVYIRGIGDFGSTAISNPAVAFNVDGVYVGRSQSLVSEFYDLKRVEVLKGPQGTLYGRNAAGGAINLITAPPELNEVNGRVSAEIANFDSQIFEAALNVPVTSTLALRASGQVVSKGGYTSENFSDDEHQSARLKAYWEPSSDVSLLLNASYGYVGGNGGGYVLPNQLPGTDEFLDATSPEGRAYIEANQFFGLPPGAVTAPSPANATQNMKFWNFSGELNWDLGFAQLTLLPAYRDAELRYATTPSFLFDVGAPFGNIPERPETSQQTSVEVRLANNSDRLKWVAGGYFYDEDQFVQSRVFSGFVQNAGYVAELGTRSYAAFGQATLGVTDTIRLIGGVRYTSDRRSMSNGQTYGVQSPVYSFDPTTPLVLLESYAGEKTFHDVSWKAGLEVDLSPDSMLFATASTGFKAGGFNQLVSLTAPAGSNIASSFEPEELTAFEIGIKNTLFDRRLQLNVEGFYWDYKDHQEAHVALSGAGNVGLVFENAGSATIYGGSTDVVFMPYASGTFHVGAEYVHSRYDDFSFLQTAAFLFPGSTGCAVLPTAIVTQAGPVVQVDCSGNQVTRSPEWSGTAGYTHVFDFPGGNALEASVNLAYASQRWLAPDFLPVERADDYVTVDASLTYQAAHGFSFTAFGRNLTNEAVYTGGTQSPFAPGVFAASVGAPRTYGARAEYRF